MEEKRKTYKEKINTTDMPDDIYSVVDAIESVKYKIIRERPFARKYILSIPNAGINAYNKLNTFVKQLAEKSINDESIIYAAVKRKLFARVINQNFNDLLGLERKEGFELNKLQTVRKPTMWERIKRFINAKFFNRYMTDDDFKEMESFLKERNRVRDKIIDDIIKRAEAVNDMEIDDKFIEQSVRDYFRVMRLEKDFDSEIFKNEVSEELKKLDIKDISDNIEEKAIEQNDFLGRIKVEQEKLSPRDSINSSDKKKEEDIVKS